MKRAGIIAFWLFVCASANSETFAQRKAIRIAEVAGRYYSSKVEAIGGHMNKIRIRPLGRKKLKIEMSLTCYMIHGEEVHGSADGEAVIRGDTVVLTPKVAGGKSCKITLKFSEPGTIIVAVENNSNCGFSQCLEADGTYKRI
jgi:hypothetical protein